MERAVIQNIGTGRPVTFRNLVEMIAAVVGFEEASRSGTSKADGRPRRMLNTTIARRSFGSTTQALLENGLRRTMEWCEADSGALHT